MLIVLTKILIALLLGGIGALLGAIGGVQDKRARRFGLPALLFGLALFTSNYWYLLIGSWSGIFSLGWGIPDETDSGSIIGRFWLKLTKKPFVADILTRGTIGVALSTILLSLGIVARNGGILAISIPLILLGTIGSRLLDEKIDLKTIKIFGEELNVDDLILFFLVTIAGVIQILF